MSRDRLDNPLFQQEYRQELKMVSLRRGIGWRRFYNKREYPRDLQYKKDVALAGSAEAIFTPERRKPGFERKYISLEQLKEFLKN